MALPFINRGTEKAQVVRYDEATVLNLLRQRPNFRRLWLGEVISLLGDWFTYVAVSLIAIEQGQGWLAVAFVLIAHSLPSALLAPVAGWVVDRFDRRTVIVGSALGRGVVTLAMGWAAYAGALWTLQILLMVRVALSAFGDTATVAALPRFLKADELARGNGLLAATWSAMFALGVAAGGLVVQFTGPELAIGVDALTFLLTAMIATGLPAIQPPTEESDAPPVSVLRRVTADLGQALRHALADRPLFRVMLAKTPAALANGGAWVWLNLRAEELGWFGTTAMTLGLMQSLRAVGTGVGPLVWARFSGNRERALDAATWLVFIGVALFAIEPSPSWLIAGAIFLWGAGSGANWVAATTRLQHLGPDHLLGRLSAADLLGHTTGQCVGALMGALVAEQLTQPSASAWVGVALAIVSWVALTWFSVPRTGEKHLEPVQLPEP